jgi:Phospholipase_D-nuclease N-terminal
MPPSGETMAERKSWSDLSTRQRVSVSALGVVQMALLLAALRDLRRRPAEQINGSKRLWTAVVFINWIGPIAYFVKGRRTG